MNQSTHTFGEVVSVNVSAAKGVTKAPISKITIDAQGVFGDGHAGLWNRQVSLLAQESISRMSTEGQTFLPGDFAENITTRGIILHEMNLLDRLTVGRAELEITQKGKKCQGGGCAVFQQVGKCIMPKEGIFCRVIRGGDVKPGDKIAYHQRSLRCLVLTLSDRVFAGEYPDQSGNIISTMINDFCAKNAWVLRLEMNVLPDNPERIEKALLHAKESGIDVVFTTGGTGIGPRDNTTEVVIRLADKIIPGIMEYLRVMSRAENPHAVLSRSVAAILGKTQVYAMPGSPRAVEMYMTEILKLLEHALYMIHGLDVH